MAEQHQLRLAAATADYGRPLREALAELARSGAIGVQLDLRNEVRSEQFGETARRQLLHLLSEHSLQTASATFPLRSSLAEPERLDARIAAIKEAMQSAWDLKSRVLIVRSGTIPEADSKHYVALLDVLRDLAAHGNRVGVTLCLSTVGAVPQRLAECLDAVDTGPLGLDFDPAGCVTAGVAPHHALRDLHRHAVHFTARDAVRVEGAGVVEVPLGRGEADWAQLVALLDEMDYRGWVTLRRTQGEDRAGDLRNAVSYLRSFDPSYEPPGGS